MRRIFPIFSLLALAAAIGWLSQAWGKLPFWAGLIIALVTLIAPAIIAEIEDRLPGGFHHFRNRSSDEAAMRPRDDNG
jgi:hypothetical protein